MKCYFCKGSGLLESDEECFCVNDSCLCKNCKKERETKMRDGESLPLANGCGVGCACSRESKDERDEGLYSTPDVFVEQYSRALESYLKAILGEEEQHIDDLVANMGAFSEAFVHIKFRF